MSPRFLLPALLAAAIGSALAVPVATGPAEAGAVQAAAPQAEPARFEFVPTAAPARPAAHQTRAYFFATDAGGAPRLLAQARPMVLEMRRGAYPDGVLPEPSQFGPVLISDDLRGPQLGVILAPDERSGVAILAVTPGSAAARAGLRSGDRLLAVDERKLAGKDGEARLNEARERIGTLEAGKPVRIRYQRDQREATVEIAPQLGERIMVYRNGDGTEYVSNTQLRTVRIERATPAVAVSPGVRTEIYRIGPNPDCDGKDKRKPCPAYSLPLISEAMRWNGLNLATVEPRLGRYFGAERGVLVLSAPAGLKGLEAGDVIQSVDGRNVDTPRETMDALRDKPEGAQVEIGYLRDRSSARLKLSVPKAVAWVPPPPPMPPPPPPAPPAPPAAPAAPVPPPPPPPPPPPKGRPEAALPAPAAPPVLPAAIV